MMDTADLLVQKIDLYSAQVLAREEKLNTGMTDLGGKMAGLGARIGDLEQKLAGGFGGGGSREHKSMGEQLIASEEFKTFRANGGLGTFRFATKAVTSGASSGGALIPPDRQTEVILGVRRQTRVPDLLAQAETTSNLIQYMKENVLTNAAAVVAESATKPESNITYELEETGVKVVATWIQATRQLMDDAPQFRSVVDGTLDYALATVVENQVLNGDGTGENITGLTTAATAYSSPWTSVGDTRIDVILKAIAQAETGSELPVTGIVLNSLDWAQMMGIKADDGDYLSKGPFSATPPTLWGRPVVPTTAMTASKFLVGNFQQAATLFTRMETEILISQDHSDFFIKNLLAIRAEKRIALVIKRPLALVYGTFPV
jgi:HK97 family phage major capsid protein